MDDTKARSTTSTYIYMSNSKSHRNISDRSRSRVPSSGGTVSISFRSKQIVSIFFSFPMDDGIDVMPLFASCKSRRFSSSITAAGIGPLIRQSSHHNSFNDGASLDNSSGSVSMGFRPRFSVSRLGATHLPPQSDPRKPIPSTVRMLQS